MPIMPTDVDVVMRHAFDAAANQIGEREFRYCGLSYEQASREAERLIKSDGWFKSWEKLAQLRQIMIRP